MHSGHDAFMKYCIFHRIKIINSMMSTAKRSNQPAEEDIRGALMPIISISPVHHA